MSLGVRLTLWQTSLLALLLTAFAVVSYRTLDSSLRAEMDRVLRERADHAAFAVQSVPNRPIIGISPGLSGEFASPALYLQILDEAGRVAARSTRKLGVSIEPIFNVHSDYAPILSPKRAGWHLPGGRFEGSFGG